MAQTKVMSSVTELAWERGWTTGQASPLGSVSLSASPGPDREPTAHLDLSELQLSNSAITQLRRDISLLRISAEEKSSFTLPPVSGVTNPSLALIAEDSVSYAPHWAEFRIDEISSHTVQESRALQYLSDGVFDTCIVAPELKKHFYARDEGVWVSVELKPSATTPQSAVTEILKGCFEAPDSESPNRYWAASILHLSEAAYRLNQSAMPCRISKVPS